MFQNYAEQESPNSQKVDSDSDGEASDDSEVSAKLRKTIEASINSYSIDDANSDKETSPKPSQETSPVVKAAAAKASSTPMKDVDEISSFSDDEGI